jgi:VanZ family protein
VSRRTAALVDWAPVAIYMVLIFASSSTPQPIVPTPGASDKVYHAVAYLGLATLVARAMTGRWVRAVTPRIALTAFLVSSTYGATDELHQRFVPGRTMDAEDLVANVLGAALGAGGLYARKGIIRGRHGL